MTTNKLDREIEKITDFELKKRIKAGVAQLRSSREFGLVFEPHLPESVRLPRHPVRLNVSVALRDGSRPLDKWVVQGFKGVDREIAALVDESGDMTEMAVKDLVVVREFGEVVYPGLKSVDRIEGGGDAPFHTVINGENFHVLQALSVTHLGKVDVIYIDPPYNTGAKDWSYNDNYVGEKDLAASSKWLSFMDRRLRLAKDLLKDSGVIFVSIDDNEQHRLRMLLDQVFDPSNFVDTLAVEMSTTSGPKTTNAQQGTIVKNVEFVHIYRRGPEFDSVVHTPLFDGVRQWDGDYALWLNDDGTITSFIDELAVAPAVHSDIEKFGFVNGKGKFLGMSCMDKLLAVSEAANEFILANSDRIARRDIPPVSCKNMDAPVRGWIEVEADRRTYLLTRLRSGTLNQVYTLKRNYRTSDDYRPQFGRTVIRGDLWKGFYQDMGNVAKEGAVKFSNGKKPIRLIKQLVRWANNSPDAVILDFFGGSGTTAHAVMSMNAEDGGRRQSIVVTNNEVGPKTAAGMRKHGFVPGDPEWEAEGVFKSVTQPRITTVATGLKADGSAYAGGIETNVEFFDLHYLERKRVRGRVEFEAIAPLLWLISGGVGPRIDRLAPEGFAVNERYAILFETDRAEPFAAAVTDLKSDTIFIVTDATETFNRVSRTLPTRARKVRLYEDYLSNFEINKELLS
jgi:adenine-specific DNA-methyltransferase